jgi:hypothetical protein
MSFICIRCEVTGRELSTGIEVAWPDFQKLPDIPARTRCPHCGQDHLWRQSEAFLSDTEPGIRRRTAAAAR